MFLLPEQADKMAGAANTYLSGDLPHREGGFAQKLLCFCNAHQKQIFIGRKPHMAFEQLLKIEFIYGKKLPSC